MHTRAASLPTSAPWPLPHECDLSGILGSIAASARPQSREALYRRRKLFCSDADWDCTSLSGTADGHYRLAGIFRLIARSERHNTSILPAGAIAQLGERVNGIHEVGGSIPPGSTNNPLKNNE
jgi:hypothetical protein